MSRIIELQSISAGTMYGPSSATDGQLIRADGETGDKYQLCTGIFVDDSGHMTSAGNIMAAVFDTNVAAAGVTLSGTALTADGTDANINIDITPKGSGEVNITKVDIDSGTIDGCTIATSDITVGAGKTFDVSAGTLTLADNQISGDKVEGGTIAAITIDALTVTNTLGIGTTASDKPLEINAATGGEIRLTYNDSDGSATDYCDISVGANGELTIASIDSDGAAGDINLKPDGATIIGDGGSVDFLKIKKSGRLSLHESARAWKCVDLEPQNVGKRANNSPTEDNYQGFVFDRFDRSTEEQVYFIWHIPSDFAVGSNSVRGHFGFFVENPPSGSGNEVVALGFEYKKLSHSDVFDFSSGTSSDTIIETIEDGESPYKWHNTDIGVCDTTDWAREDLILFRFYRDATNAADTYDNEAVAANNDVWIGIYHLEYLSDAFGEYYVSEDELRARSGYFLFLIPPIPETTIDVNDIYALAGQYQEF